MVFRLPTDGSTLWQVDVKRCPLTRLTVGHHVATVFLDNLMGNRKSQPVAILLSGKKGIEYVLQIPFLDPNPSKKKEHGTGNPRGNDGKRSGLVPEPAGKAKD